MGKTKTAGVRELKARLSSYLRDVRHGETVLVSDRGELVAKLAPLDEEDLAGSELTPGLRKLIAEGTLHPPQSTEPFELPSVEEIRQGLTDEQRAELMQALRDAREDRL